MYKKIFLIFSPPEDFNLGKPRVMAVHGTSYSWFITLLPFQATRLIQFQFSVWVDLSEKKVGRLPIG